MRITKLQCITFVIIALLSTLFLVNSCKHEGIPADQLPPVPFSKVKVIYSSYCGTCHDGNSDEADYNFNDSIDIIRSVVPYNAAKSKSYKAMISTFQIMPPDGSMPTSDRTLVRIWIEQGAKP